MSQIRPINGHVLIEPVKHDSFITSQKETYQEIGVIMDYDVVFQEPGAALRNDWLKRGNKVLFDAWLAKKYPKEGSTNEYYWLVRYSDIVAYEEA